MATLKSTIENDLETIFNELNDVSCDFVTDYDLTDFEDRDPADSFYNYADNYTPVYYSDVERDCTDELINNYLNEIESFEGLEFGRVADAVDECITKKEFVNPDTRVTAAIVLPYLRKVRASLKENGNADNN